MLDLSKLFNITKKSLSSQSYAEEFIHERTFNLQKVHRDCLTICDTLNKHGYDAWIVGGCIRDLILNKSPKDFDVVTIATPQQIEKVFLKKCQIIGRRFQVCHVYYRYGQFIEVATLRKKPKKLYFTNTTGRILQDNSFGKSLQEDATRRDFTINAIYYNPKEDHCIDFNHGIGDLQNRLLTSIGVANKRFIEDPVRMLRAVRLTAKLNLTIAEEEKTAIALLSNKLSDIPAARRLDESLKFFLNGHALKSYQLLKKYDLLKYLLIAPDDKLKGKKKLAKTERFLSCMLSNTDNRFKEKKSLSPSYLLACFLWSGNDYLFNKKKLKSKYALKVKYQGIIKQFASTLNVPVKWQQQILHIWLLQHDLESVGIEKNVQFIMTQRSFRAAFDLMCLREQSQQEQLEDKIAFWTKAQKETIETIKKENK